MSNLYIESRLQAIKEIASKGCVDYKDADNISNFCDEIYSAIPNIDKVIAELEKEKNKFAPLLKQSNKAGDFVMAEIYSQLASEYTTAIEIVKQGGVSDDVCEWKFEDEEANLYLTGCQQRQLIFEGTPKENGYRYCHYCGKKIKVVE